MKKFHKCDCELRELFSYFEALQIEIEHILMKRFELNNLLDGSPGLGGGALVKVYQRLRSYSCPS